MIRFIPYWLKNDVEIIDIADIDKSNLNGDMVIAGECPLSFKLLSEPDSAFWTFPLEPIISVSCKNNIVKRQVLKMNAVNSLRRGTVKELWSQDDYEINIGGIFKSPTNGIPSNDTRMLRKYCEAREVISVKNDFLNLFAIDRITIEDYDFPFSRGLKNQQFTIKATSDDFDINDLLIQS